jgi:hypothetical protein
VAPEETGPWTYTPEPVEMAPMYGSKLEALRGAPDSRIVETEGGYNAEPPKRMGRGKAIGLGLLRGLSMGGLGGLLAGGLVGAISPGSVQKFERRQEIGQAQNEAAQDMQTQRVGLQNADLASEIEARNAATRGLPSLQRQKTEEAERDNLRQLYNAQPAFNADSNPQHRAMAERAKVLGIVLPNRDEKDNWALEWVDGRLQRVSRRSGEIVPTGLTRSTDVPVVEDGLTVTPGQALLARAQTAKLDREGQQSQFEAQGQEALALQAETDAKSAETTIKQMEADLAKMPKFVPVHPETGEVVPTGAAVQDSQGNVIQPVLRSNPELDAMRSAISSKRTEYNDATGRARTLRSQASTSRSKAAPLTRNTKTLAPDVEARIRAEAIKRNLDPNIAVQRALARK